jgi:biotin transporter BioY
MIAVIVVAIVFSNLAAKYKKSKWSYALLGIVTYFGASFACGFVYVMISSMINPDITDQEIETALAFRSLAIGVGILASYLLYYYLNRNWKKQQEGEKVNIDDIGKN